MPMEEYRTWRLCKIMGCRPSELDDESAVKLDWLIAVDDAVTRARNNVESRAGNGS